MCSCAARTRSRYFSGDSSRSDRSGSGARRRRRARAASAADCRSAISRAWAGRVAVFARSQTRWSVARSCTARCSTRSANAESGPGARAAGAARGSTSAPARSRGRRTSRPANGSGFASIARRAPRRAYQASRLSRKPPGPTACQWRRSAPCGIARQPGARGSTASMLKRASGPCAALSSNTG